MRDVTEDVHNPLDLSELSWLEQAVEGDLFAYLLSIDREISPAAIVGEMPLSEAQTDLVRVLTTLKGQVPADLDDASKAEVVRAWLTQMGPDGVVIARAIHNHTSGDEETVPPTEDEIEAPLIQMALDSYPAFLLPPDPTPIPIPFMVRRPSIRVPSILIRHPQRAAFDQAVLKDSVFEKVFQHQTEPAGVYGMVYRNTGSGGSLQLVMLPQILLNNAWRHLEDRSRSPEEFSVQALQELQFTRDVFAGKPQSVTAKLGLMGVLLPNSTSHLNLPKGVVRAVTDEERRLAPESLKGQLSGTDSAGNTTIVNYDGDLVLEYQFPYRVRAINQPMDGTPPKFPEDMRPPAELEEVLLRLRFSLMLAVERESRVQIVPTWRYFDDPLSIGNAFGWSDPRQGVGIMPIQLTELEVTAWGEWYKRLSTVHVGRIELALSRILRALAERREPSDVLIDSVIAWENLFGTKEGEPTFRISTSLAVLLEDSFDARADLKKKLSDIYGLRSKVVHGSRNLRQNEYPLCQEALEIAIRAIRALTTTRTDILELPDGAARSSTLLLGSDTNMSTKEQSLLSPARHGARGHPPGNGAVNPRAAATASYSRARHRAPSPGKSPGEGGLVMRTALALSRPVSPITSRNRTVAALPARRPGRRASMAAADRETGAPAAYAAAAAAYAQLRTGWGRSEALADLASETYVPLPDPPPAPPDLAAWHAVAGKSGPG